MSEIGKRVETSSKKVLVLHFQVVTVSGQSSASVTKLVVQEGNSVPEHAPTHRLENLAKNISAREKTNKPKNAKFAPAKVNGI